MTHRILNKIQPPHGLASIALVCMMGAFIKLAFAIAAFSPQNQPTGYTGQVTVTNGTLTSGTESLFRSEYEKSNWSGNLYSYPIDANGTIATAAENWSGGAAVHINAQNFSTGRFIGTMKDDGSKVPLLSASLSAAQQGTLAATVNATAYTSTQIVNFLRGDHSNESATTLRQRLTPQGSSTTPTVLGDIIHSKPFYQADTTYPTIFVGANDGMLHAINSDDGSERWAYVPSMLLSKMSALAANPYTHDYYVDGQITVGNATISGTSTRILVGALGAGGKGLYALNINGSAGLTAASDQDAANKVLWEITPTKVNYATPQNNDSSANATAYSNLGYTYGKPIIATINDGGSPLEVVITGNGYNNGGDYQAYLYVINASNGRLVRAIKADSTCCTGVTNGTAGSPNGLINTLVFDTNSDGYADRVYAGSLNGTLFKFDLSSTAPASWTASALHNTSPAQPITATPAAIAHPSGIGYMVNFATGAIFSGTQPITGTGATGDLSDTSTFYVYGIWDGAPVSNTALVQPVLTERCYNNAGAPSAPPCPSGETRVRRITSSAPDWSTGGNKGWKVALPIGGERVVGEGSFISSGRYYFSTYNPTISYLVPTTTTYTWGENWQMALDSVSGGSADPFMDLDGNGTITSNDRIKYEASDAAVIAATQIVNTPILSPNVDGIEVGKWVARGVQSQPTLVKLASLFTTLFNSNPDVTIPPLVVPQAGVTGGHFDVEIYYGPVTASTQPTATITVGNTGDTLPATLGGIEIDGVSIVPALTVADITDGSASSTNATTIKNKVSSTIYTATVSGNTITINAPVGTAYNGKVLTVLPGTSSVVAGTAGVRPTGLVIFGGSGTTSGSSSGARINNDNSGDSLRVGTTSVSSSTITIGLNKTPAQAASAFVSAIGTGGNIKAYLGGNSITPACAAAPSPQNQVVCLVDTTTYSNGKTIYLGSPNSRWNSVTYTVGSTTSGGVPAIPASGYRDLSPVLSVTNFSGGTDGSTSGDTCAGSCYRDVHVHQYDDKYDVTGVNMLNASQKTLNLVKAIPNISQKFKVILHNQYLNPAVNLHIGNANYLPNINFGYVSVKNYTTSATLDLASLPTYNRDPASTGDGLTTGTKFIGSLAFNMPVDALTPKNWWGNGDVRVGLLPADPSCVYEDAGTRDGNMYKPIKAPANDITLGYPLDGPGTAGWSTTTTPATATGVRHGGALTVQIIKFDTPNSALELNDHLGRPEYGWRVKSSLFSTYVLAEYTTFWHNPNDLCFNATGWSKTPGADNGSTATIAGEAGATDPKIGNLSGSSSNVSSVVTTGDTTTVTYVDGSRDIIQKIINANGTVTTITTNFPGGVTGTITHVINSDGSITSTLITGGVTYTGTASGGGSVAVGGGVTTSNSTTANTAGSTGSGGLLNQNALGYRRISWKELIRN